MSSEGKMKKEQKRGKRRGKGLYSVWELTGQAMKIKTI